MNGAEHYREAERLLREAHEAVQRRLPVEAARPDAAQVYANIMARAQVHAILAQAAATVDAGEASADGNGMPPAWHDTIHPTHRSNP